MAAAILGRAVKCSMARRPPSGSGKSNTDVTCPCSASVRQSQSASSSRAACGRSELQWCPTIAAARSPTSARSASEREAATLASLGMEFGQGYLFGRPAPAREWAEGPGRERGRSGP